MRRAFTVIELIVVVSVLMILFGILVPVVSSLRERARRQLAHTRLKAICLALERHYADLSVYPPDTNDDPWNGNVPDDGDGSEPDSLYWHLCRAQPLADGRVVGPYIEFKKNDLEPFDRGGEESFIALDPWGRPWIYEENRSHFEMEEPDTYPSDDTLVIQAHHPMHYDIFSLGSDGEYDPDNTYFQDDDPVEDKETAELIYDGLIDEEDELGDDIANW